MTKRLATYLGAWLASLYQFNRRYNRHNRIVFFLFPDRYCLTNPKSLIFSLPSKSREL